AVHSERRERREVRVVELVAGGVLQPEPQAADVVPADRVDDAVGDGEERRPEGAEDVLAVVPARVRARGTEGVPVRGGPVDGEDISAGRQLREDVERDLPDRRESRRLLRLLLLRLLTVRLDLIFRGRRLPRRGCPRR